MSELAGHEEWTQLTIVEGSAQAEILRGLLEAQEIPVILSQEGVAHFAYSVSVGPLSEVEVLVPSGKIEAARQVFNEYWLGTSAAGAQPEGTDTGEPDAPEIDDPNMEDGNTGNTPAPG